VLECGTAIRDTAVPEDQQAMMPLPRDTWAYRNIGGPSDTAIRCDNLQAGTFRDAMLQLVRRHGEEPHDADKVPAYAYTEVTAMNGDSIT
jgi:hypothetical protein